MKKVLKKYGIKPSKRLGQNFLTDKSVLKKIIKASDLSINDIVLEIGPGLGILTIELAKRARKVIAIEKDRGMCKALKNILKDYKNVEIINADILKMEETKSPNVGDLVSNINIKDYKLVANLPYYITSPAIRKFLETKNQPQLMVLMVQKEVAQRIVAKPGKMSLLSVAVQFYAVPEIVSYVSKKSFYPQPCVDSAIIKMVPRKSILLSASMRDQFFEFVRKGFSSKRKMLKNNLKIDIKSKARAQELSIKDWLELYETFKK